MNKMLYNSWSIKKFGSLPDINLDRHQTTSKSSVATYQINNVQHYVSVITLSVNDNIKLLENIKEGFKKKILGVSIDLSQMVMMILQEIH